MDGADAESFRALVMNFLHFSLSVFVLSLLKRSFKNRWSDSD